MQTSTRNVPVLPWLAALALLMPVGCKDKQEARPQREVQVGQTPDPAQPAPGTPEAGDKPAQSKPADKKPRRKQPLVARKDVQTLVESWLAAQNSGDFDAYMASYSADFRGVRRSGQKTVRLDRAGWQKERKRMFKREMEVALRDVEIAVSPGGAEVRFVQDWKSGKYHDVGPKKLIVRKSEDGLRIAREEMLRSTLLAASSQTLPLASPALALVQGNAIVLSSRPDPDWGTGPATLRAGAVPERDPRCDDDPPDYEEENERYFYCFDNGPENTTDEFHATRAVAEKRLPQDLAAWAGRALTLYRADGTSCPARIGAFVLSARWHTTTGDVGGSDDDDATLATAVMDGGKTLLLAELVGACSDALFARSAELPAVALWTLAPAAGEKRDATEKALYEDVGELLDEMRENGPFAPKTHTWHATPGPNRGTALAIGSYSGAVDCQEDGFAVRVWHADAVAKSHAPDYLFADDDQEFEVRAALDANGDGNAELITDRGFLAWTGSEYSHYQPLYVPAPVVEACYCECE